jgi:hypothetical protein
VVTSPETVKSELLSEAVLVGLVVVSVAPVVTVVLEDEVLEDEVLVVSPSVVVFESLQAESAIPRVRPRVVKRLPRTVPHAAWQKGQVVVPSNTWRSQVGQERMHTTVSRDRGGVKA